MKRAECAHSGCDATPRNTAGFLCVRHWLALPRELRDEIWDAFRKRDREASGSLIIDALRYLRETQPAGAPR
jgi:hypothetical protein